MDLHSEIEISRPVAEAMARALYTIAKVDGLHEREAGLIASFWVDAGHGAAALSDLERAPAFKPQDLAGALQSQEQRLLFMKTAILLTWADGKVSDAEAKAIRDFAAALGIDKAALDQLDAQVKDFLLGHLVHLSNTDATKKVAKKLGV